MSQEIETPYRVDSTKLPDLSNLAYDDITQVYYTPLPKEADPRYPEVANAEWRVREKVDPRGNVRYATALKFGDKKSGSRTELETPILTGAFGTRQEDINRYGLGIVRKRRFHLDKSFVVDVYDPETHGELALAEMEFESREHQAAWQPPEWCTPADDIPSNREIAAPLTPGYMRERSTDQAHGSHEDLATYLYLLRTMGSATVATVSGMSGSGKSTTTRMLATLLDATAIEADHFHIGARNLLERHGEVNHDMPHAYDYEHAGRAALELINGQTVALPQYSYETAERTDETRTVHPTLSRNVVIDGLFAEHAKDVLDEAEDVNVLRVLVDTPLYVSLVRRILRDTTTITADSERKVAFTPEETLKYVVETAIPTFLAHHDPSSFDFAVH